MRFYIIRLTQNSASLQSFLQVSLPQVNALYQFTGTTSGTLSTAWLVENLLMQLVSLEVI